MSALVCKCLRFVYVARRPAALVARPSAAGAAARRSRRAAGQRLAAFFADFCVLLKVRFGARLLVATHLRVVVIGRFDKLHLDVLRLVLGEFTLLPKAPRRRGG